MEETKYPEQIEIVWAVKYFLDALYWKNRADFHAQSGEFFQTYPKPDGTILVIDKDKASLGRMEICE